MFWSSGSPGLGAGGRRGNGFAKLCGTNVTAMVLPLMLFSSPFAFRVAGASRMEMSPLASSTAVMLISKELPRPFSPGNTHRWSCRRHPASRPTGWRGSMRWAPSRASPYWLSSRWLVNVRIGRSLTLMHSGRRRGQRHLPVPLKAAALIVLTATASGIAPGAPTRRRAPLKPHGVYPARGNPQHVMTRYLRCGIRISRIRREVTVL